MHKTCVIHNNFTETHVHPAFHPVGNGVVRDVSILLTGWQWLPGDGNISGSNRCDIELWSSRWNLRWGEGRKRRMAYSLHVYMDQTDSTIIGTH